MADSDPSLATETRPEDVLAYDCQPIAPDLQSAGGSGAQKFAHVVTSENEATTAKPDKPPAKGEQDAGLFVFADPTERLPPAWRDEPRFSMLAREAEDYARELQKRHALFVSCEHAEMLDAAAAFVMQGECFRGKNYGWRSLLLDYAHGVSLQHLLHESQVKIIGREDRDKEPYAGYIVVVDVGFPAAFQQFEACCERMKKPRWAAQPVFFIFTILPEAAGGGSLQKLPEEIPHWKVPSLCLLLAPEGSPTDRTRQLENELLRARSEQLWSGSEAEFLRDVDRLMGEGGEAAVRVELTRRRERGPGGEVGAPAVPRLRAGVIATAALFVATHFPSLSVDDFHQVMAPLLMGEKLPPAGGASLVPPRQDGSVHGVEPEQDDAFACWERTMDDVLEQAGLVYVDHPSDGMLIELADPAQRSAARQAVGVGETRRFFERLHKGALLFQLEASRRVVNGFLSLTVEMVKNYPRYDARWLLDCVRNIELILHEYATGNPVNVGPGTNPIEVLDSALTIVVHGRRLSDFLYSRLAQLACRLLADSRCAGRLCAFVDLIIAQGKGDGTHALQILRRIPEIPGFDRFKYLGHIISSSRQQTRALVTQLLIGELRQSPEAAWAALRRIAEWHPGDGGVAPEDNHVRPRDAWSLAFLYFACCPEDESAGGPPEFLFAEGVGLPSEEERHELLVQWLGHSLFPAAAAQASAREQHIAAWMFTDIAAPAYVARGDACLGQILETWYVRGADPRIGHLVVKLAAVLRARPVSRLRPWRLRVFFGWRAECVQALSQRERDPERLGKLYEHRSRLFDLMKLLEETA